MHSYQLAKDWESCKKIWYRVFLFSKNGADEFCYTNESEQRTIEAAVDARTKGCFREDCLQYWIEKARKTHALSEIADVLRERVCECNRNDYCGIHSNICRGYSNQSIVAYQQVFYDLQNERRNRDIQAFRNEILAHLAEKGDQNIDEKIADAIVHAMKYLEEI